MSNWFTNLFKSKKKPIERKATYERKIAPRRVVTTSEYSDPIMDPVIPLFIAGEMSEQNSEQYIEPRHFEFGGGQFGGSGAGSTFDVEESRFDSSPSNDYSSSDYSSSSYDSGGCDSSSSCD